MTDRELLGLAAKAAGYGEVWYLPGGETPYIGERYELGRDVAYKVWNPLANDAHAFGLMVTLGLVVHVGSDAARALYDGEGCTEEYSGDKAASTRRAIVRCAADLGARK